MAEHDSTPRLPEQFRSGVDDHADFSVSELAAENAGAHSPFGDLQFPLPPESLFYLHPGPADRPRLAGER